MKSLEPKPHPANPPAHKSLACEDYAPENFCARASSLVKMGTSRLRILIVGYGNPLRSDDALGWRAAEDLSRRLASPETEFEVEVITSHQLTPELADTVSHADVVFFMDAAHGAVPGELTCEAISTPPADSHISTSLRSAVPSHHCSPHAVLLLAQQLYGAVPRAFALSLCGECFDHGQGLSASVEAALPNLTALVERMIRQIHKPHL